jgi:hypothetical protein
MIDANGLNTIERIAREKLGVSGFANGRFDPPGCFGRVAASMQSDSTFLLRLPTPRCAPNRLHRYHPKGRSAGPETSSNGGYY